MVKVLISIVILLFTSSSATAIAFQTLDDPLGVSTWATGVSGNHVVGYYADGGSVTHGFLYDGSTFVTLNDPDAGTGQSEGTFPEGLAATPGGYDIVGYYIDSGNLHHAFLYDG